MKILQFPQWMKRDPSVQQSPHQPFKPSPSVIRGYAKDIEKYGEPMDSDFSNYFRKCAEYYAERQKS